MKRERHFSLVARYLATTKLSVFSHLHVDNGQLSINFPFSPEEQILVHSTFYSLRIYPGPLELQIFQRETSGYKSSLPSLLNGFSNENQGGEHFYVAGTHLYPAQEVVFTALKESMKWKQNNRCFTYRKWQVKSVSYAMLMKSPECLGWITRKATSINMNLDFSRDQTPVGKC